MSTSNVSSLVTLIKTLSQNSQDETDPNNVVLQKYQSPNELNQLGESVTITDWNSLPAWVGGSVMTFARNSIAFNADGTTSMPNTPRFVTGKFGKGLLVEEPTTNWILNSDFMATDTTPDAIFSDDMTNLNGQVWSMVPGTNSSGTAVWPTFSYGTNGATVLTGTDATLVAGNPNWKAMTSTVGGWSVQLQFQITLITGTSLQGNDGAVYFFKDANNWYRAVLANKNFYIQKMIYGGTTTTIASAAVSTEAVNTQYCINLEIDVNGTVSSQLYLNNSNGTQLANISVVDNSIPQGFQFAVSGDPGVSLKYATAWGPLPQGWSCNPNSAWSNVVALGPSITSKGYNSLQLAHDLQWTSLPTWDSYAQSSSVNYGSSLANTTWTFTFTAMSSVAGPVTLFGTMGPKGGNGNYLSNSPSLLTFTQANVPQTFTITGTFPSSETATTVSIVLRPPTNGGITITYGGLQLENMAYATSHHRNDGTSVLVSRAVEALSIPSSLLTPSQGTINLWLNVTANTQRQVSGINPIIFVVPNASNYACLEVFHSSNSAIWELKVANDANSPVYATFSDVSLGWHMFTVRWSSTSVDCFVDAVLVATISNPALSTSFYTKTYFGIAKDGLSYSIDSVMDDITVFNRFLSNTEILNGYNANQPLFTDSSTTCKMYLNGDLSNQAKVTFNWNQGGYYAYKPEVMTCLMLI